jgi:CRP/FNR family transcriptional regulator, cyclic AMP receptor protein
MGPRPAKHSRYQDACSAPPFGTILLAMGDPKIDALKGVPLFSRCSHKELEFLASRTDEVDLHEGQTLIRQGSPADSFFALLDGEASVVVDGKGVATLRPGDFFGEISMLDRGPATATVTASQAARAMVMSHAQFRDAVRANESILSSVMSVMADRLREDELERPSR